MNVSAGELFAADLLDERRGLKNAIVVSPDHGGGDRAQKVAEKLGVGFAIMYKQRGGPNEVASMELLGKVKGRNAVLVDDIADTCGTILKCADILLDKGAKSVRACVSHGLFSGAALEKIEKSPILEIVVTDTIDNPEADKSDKIRRVSIASKLVETIRRTVVR